MALGKRLSTGDPLTEHDVADRIDKAALRLLRIMSDIRELEMMEPVKHSRYLTGVLEMLAAELEAWSIKPARGRTESTTTDEDEE